MNNEYKEIKIFICKFDINSFILKYSEYYNKSDLKFRTDLQNINS